MVQIITRSGIAFIISMLFILSSCSGKSKESKGEETTNDSLSLTKAYIEADVYETDAGELKVTLVGHGSLMFQFEGKTIQVDPYAAVADYSQLPKADLVLLTHEHADHLDTVAINYIKKEDTKYIISKSCSDVIKQGQVIANGEKTVWSGIEIEAVPAYNIVHKNDKGIYFHPKGIGNGYILTFGNKKVYVAADTENIPEMDVLKDQIDIAFLPKNLPYTMTDKMFIDAALKVAPKFLYPYHMSEFDEVKIGEALIDSNIKLIIRPMSQQ